MGAEFLSLRVKIPAFWLGERRNPQSLNNNNKKCKRT
jgi:hypothetical protein